MQSLSFETGFQGYNNPENKFDELNEEYESSFTFRDGSFTSSNNLRGMRAYDNITWSDLDSGHNYTRRWTATPNQFAQPGQIKVKNLNTIL